MSFPERFAGVVAINGWLPSGLRPLGRLKACRDLPLLVVHGAWNARVPLHDARQRGRDPPRRRPARRLSVVPQLPSLDQPHARRRRHLADGPLYGRCRYLSRGRRPSPISPLTTSRLPRQSRRSGLLDRHSWRSIRAGVRPPLHPRIASAGSTCFGLLKFTRPRRASGVARSVRQILTVPSWLEHASDDPSGLKASEWICPEKSTSECSSWAVSTSHRRIGPVSPAEARIRLSGENASARKTRTSSRSRLR